jgi:ketose-bisphosphate aldolase
MLVSTKELFKTAQKRGFGIPAPNFYNSDSIKTYIETAAKNNFPVIVSFAEVHLDLISMEEAAALGKFYANKYDIPVALHLDHGMTYSVIVNAIKNGFTSVMIDASSKSFEENVRLTKEIVKVAHAVNVAVEAEIGHVGAGENYENHEKTESMYTKTEEAVKFVELTNIDSLAVSVGTAHGSYTGIPEINFERLKEIHEKVSVPLVLHGGSSTGDENLRKCVEFGISKINLFTDLVNAGMKAAEDSGTGKDLLSMNKIVSNGMGECLEHYFKVFKTERI